MTGVQTCALPIFECFGSATSFGTLCVANGGGAGWAFDGGVGTYLGSPNWGYAGIGAAAGTGNQIAFPGSAGGQGLGSFNGVGGGSGIGGMGGVMWGGTPSGSSAVPSGSFTSGTPALANTGTGGGGAALANATGTGWTAGGNGGSGLCVVTEFGFQ